VSTAKRRSLSNIGGAIDTAGDPRGAKLLARALDVAPARAPGTKRIEDDPDRVHVHGFHAYPARMHPATAARLVHGFTRRGATVLDPFCGSGTVLVEALLAGCSAVGTELNPLAVRLATLKTRPHTDAELDRLALAARAAAAFADARRKARAGATRRYAAEDVALFDPHVLLELDGLRAGIAEARPEQARDDLGLVLSAVLVKVSKKQGDTSEHLGPRRLAGGYTARLFVRKAEELVQRLRAFARELPVPRPDARVLLDDATRLTKVADASIDAIITSPPYVATYDYLAHHALRMRWLGLDAEPLERGEIGARRRFAALRPREAREAWGRELLALLRAAARALRRGGPIVLLMADSAVGTEALRADEIVESLASAAHLRPVARASQRRPHFHTPTAAAFRRTPRAEHALLLERV
jgi:SAM-dependent methyltransferase